MINIINENLELNESDELLCFFNYDRFNNLCCVLVMHY